MPALHIHYQTSPLEPDLQPVLSEMLLYLQEDHEMEVQAFDLELLLVSLVSLEGASSLEAECSAFALPAEDVKEGYSVELANDCLGSSVDQERKA